MAANEVNTQGFELTMPVPAAGAASLISGAAVMFGRGVSPGFGLAGVCETSYTPPTGTATGNIAVKYVGVFLLAVLGKASVGGASVTLAPGDKVYAEGGTYDATTGCLYGFTLTANVATGIYYGNVLDAVVGGTTTTVRVRLKVSGD